PPLLVSHSHLPNPLPSTFHFFLFNVPSTTEIYTLSLHDALPISATSVTTGNLVVIRNVVIQNNFVTLGHPRPQVTKLFWITTLRSEEHTSELQSRGHLVCRLLLEKKKKK